MFGMVRSSSSPLGEMCLRLMSMWEELRAAVESIVLTDEEDQIF